MLQNINGILYVKLFNKHSFHFHSLEEHLYFLLQDIYINCDNYTYKTSIKQFIFELTDKKKRWTNILNNIDYLRDLIYWLDNINAYIFTDINVLVTDINDTTFVKYDEWLYSFSVLLFTLKDHYHNLSKNI